MKLFIGYLILVSGFLVLFSSAVHGGDMNDLDVGPLVEPFTP